MAEICLRLDGLPLAIELAAARTRLLDPGALLRRLTRSLDALGTGAVDLPERQRTLRATVEWSVGLLEDAERSLLEVAAVFVDGWTVEAAAQVADLDEDRALDLTEALARHSLVYLELAGDNPRPRMLETIRAFAAERLTARRTLPRSARHAGYYRALAEQADRRLRGADQLEWCGRLDAEQGNLAAAVRWYLGHDTRAAPHVPGPVALLVPAGPSGRGPLLGRPAAARRRLLRPPARAELAWTAAATGVEVGDDQAALAARERLAPLLDGIGDPYFRAVSQLVMAWTSGIVGDFDGAIRGRRCPWSSSVAGRAIWTALAAYTTGLVEITVGRYDDAQRHLTEMRDLAERSATPGSPPSPACIWACWPWRRAGPSRPARRWTKGWS